MRVSAVGWFVIGLVVGVTARVDWIDAAIGSVPTVAAGIVQVLAWLAGLGIVGLLIVLAIGLFVGTDRADRAKARASMDKTWRERSNYRKK